VTWRAAGILGLALLAVLPLARLVAHPVAGLEGTEKVLHLCPE